MIEIIAQAPAGAPHPQWDDCRTPLPLQDCRAPLHDCRAPLAPPAVEMTAAAPAVLRPHPLLRTLPLDADYAVAFVPSHSRVAVLNQAALALIARLPLNTHAADAADTAALAQLQRSRAAA
jgi:uncharacterized protein